MFTKVEKTDRNISQADTNHVTKKQNIGKSGNRLEASPPGAAALSAYQAMADNNPQYEPIVQMQAMANDFSTAQPMPLLKKENLTGLPNRLKTGIENLSGFSMDDVRVHYNSNKPAQLQALAYAQGTDIHMGPGQEKHLPHEAWHVVQQKQGRVQPTRHLKGKIPVNDDAGLEKEADIMGNAAFLPSYSGTFLQKSDQGNMLGKQNEYIQKKSSNIDGSAVIQRLELEKSALDAAIVVVRNSNISPGMLLEGYEPILDENQKKAIDVLNEIKNIMRFKEEFDTRPEVVKIFNQGVSMLTKVDGSGVLKTLDHLLTAHKYIVQAYNIYNAREEQVVKPLISEAAPQKDYGTV